MKDSSSLVTFRDKGHAACVFIQLCKDIFSQVSVDEEDYRFMYDFLKSTMQYYFKEYLFSRFHDDPDDEYPF